MLELNTVVLCLGKIKSKNLEQNPDNFNYDWEKAMKLIEETIANIKKSAIFNGQVTFRIIKGDSNADDTIIVPETQGDNFHIVRNDVIEDRNCTKNKVFN